MATNDKNSAVVVVKGDNADAQRKIAETLSTFKKFADAVNAQSPIAVKAFKSEADAAKDLLAQLGASDKQMASFGNTTRRVEQAAESFKDRTGTALRSVSGGLLEMAHSGDVSSRALKEVVAQGAEMALSFGAGGPIVGALGIAGIAIFEVFDHARQQIEETRKKFEDEIDAMVRKADQVGLITRLRDIDLGDPAKGASSLVPGAFVGGLKDLQAQAAQLRNNPDALAGGISAATSGTAGVLAGLVGSVGARATLADLEKQIAEMIRERDELTKRIMNPVQLPPPITMLRDGGVTVGGSPSSGATSKADYAAMVRNTRLAEAADAAQRKGFSAQDQALIGLIPGSTNPRPDSQRVTAADAAASGAEGLNSIGNLPGAWDRIAASIVNATGAQQDFGSSLEDLAAGSIKGFADASVNAFTQWASGSKKIGDALRQGVGGAIVDIAGKKAKLYFAEALADTAEGFLGHPGAWAAAGEHAAAGAAMLAIAGGGAALAGNGGGGGGGRGASNNISMGDSFSTMEKQPLELNLVGDYFDPSDTRFVDKFVAVMESVSGRRVVVNR